MLPSTGLFDKLLEIARGYEADGLLEVHSRVTCELLDHLKGESVVCRQLQLQV
ncbi:hypothetical protein UY3_12948 [Chelonia mydas]|uniref:Uncharacterized protein n=1 Tax=Chelonia mydas TaxID=8469 RepID=M7AWU4_CHEMY|nr:hypothetical protein UY3_12948 [Chelonia mydas]